MTYVTVNMGLSKANIQALLAGTAIRVPKDEMKGNIPVLLTGAQSARIGAAAAKGKGAMLQFSSRQIGAIMKKGQSGGGWLDWLTKPLGEAAKDIIRPIGEIARENPELTQMAINAGVKALSGKGTKTKAKGGIIGNIFGFGPKKLTPQAAAGLRL